jgi:hypothetical protein
MARVLTTDANLLPDRSGDQPAPACGPVPVTVR